MSLAPTSLPRLLALGGGGFSTQPEDAVLETVLMELVHSDSPTVGYIGTANFDDFQRTSQFHHRFGELGASTLDLPTSATLRSASKWLQKLDALYVAGGNTRHLLTHWRASGQDQLLIEAANAGLMLSGVSAGAVCWFEHALSDSTGKGLQPMACLGVFHGSCCPHYDTEEARLPAYEQCIANGDLPEGIAIDDGAAVLMKGNSATGVYTARQGAGAVKVSRARDGVISTRLPILYPGFHT